MKRETITFILAILAFLVVWLLLAMMIRTARPKIDMPLPQSADEIKMPPRIYDHDVKG